MDHRPRKRFGQHFLHERTVIQRIVDAIDPQPGQHLAEIGPGRGALTERLLERIDHLHAIEIDRDLAAMLLERHPPERLTLHLGDALSFDFGGLPAPLRVVGNLPYNISTPLLFHLARFADRIVDGHFMLQREVVDRMVAPPGGSDYGRLSVTLQFRFAMRRLFLVPAGAFTPPPKVESAIVRMEPLAERLLPAPLEAVFERIVTRAFTQRRKTLRNALASEISATALEAIGIDPGVRPETLDVAAFARIARAIGD